jgi:hypothetical protein
VPIIQRQRVENRGKERVTARYRFRWLNAQGCMIYPGDFNHLRGRLTGSHSGSRTVEIRRRVASRLPIRPKSPGRRRHDETIFCVDRTGRSTVEVCIHAAIPNVASAE